ncbi:MAG: hypothetical protein ACI9R3_000060 [Verrucomicrobiales bacterium]|jgi:hypothetical protein
MNEDGDVTHREVVEGNITRLHLYVRSLDKPFAWESGVFNYWPTGINDNLQVSLVYKDIIRDTYSSPLFRGSGLLTFNFATEIGEFEPLSDYAESFAEPLLLPWGGLNNAGDVFGCFETEVSRIRVHRNRVVSRVADTTAGFIAAGSNTWSELDARLPVGGTQANHVSYAAAACALDVNEVGQVVGGYQCIGRFSNGEDFWLLDPDDGLFDVKDLVAGDAADVEAFRAANEFKLVGITDEIDSETGYGIISGSASYSGPVFILTPRLVEQP